MQVRKTFIFLGSNGRMYFNQNKGGNARIGGHWIQETSLSTEVQKESQHAATQPGLN